MDCATILCQYFNLRLPYILGEDNLQTEPNLILNKLDAIPFSNTCSQTRWDSSTFQCFPVGLHNCVHLLTSILKGSIDVFLVFTFTLRKPRTVCIFRWTQPKVQGLQARKSTMARVCAHRGNRKLTVCKLVKSESPSVVDRLLQVASQLRVVHIKVDES